MTKRQALEMIKNVRPNVVGRWEELLKYLDKIYTRLATDIADHCVSRPNRKINRNLVQNVRACPYRLPQYETLASNCLGTWSTCGVSSFGIGNKRIYFQRVSLSASASAFPTSRGLKLNTLIYTTWSPTRLQPIMLHRSFGEHQCRDLFFIFWRGAQMFPFLVTTLNTSMALQS